MKKTLIIVRHAHRNTEDHTKDNGLSLKGQAQVKKLTKFAKRRMLGTQPTFLTSPKKRCIETLLPMSKELGAKLAIDDLLVERGPLESDALVLARVEEFLDHWKYESKGVTVICTHGDWIPLAIEKLTGSKTGLKKAGWAEIEYLGTSSILTWLVQKLY